MSSSGLTPASCPPYIGGPRPECNSSGGSQESWSERENHLPCPVFGMQPRIWLDFWAAGAHCRVSPTPEILCSGFGQSSTGFSGGRAGYLATFKSRTIASVSFQPARREGMRNTRKRKRISQCHQLRGQPAESGTKEGPCRKLQ